jgi:hypothetical protein
MREKIHRIGEQTAVIIIREEIYYIREQTAAIIVRKIHRIRKQTAAIIVREEIHLIGKQTAAIIYKREYTREETGGHYYGVYRISSIIRQTLLPISSARFLNLIS